jgi:hypothetical protein
VTLQRRSVSDPYLHCLERNSLDVQNLGTGQDLDPLLGRDVVGDGSGVLAGVHQQEVQLKDKDKVNNRSCLLAFRWVDENSSCQHLPCSHNRPSNRRKLATHVLDVGDNNRLQTVGHHVLGLLVGTVSNLGHRGLTLKPSSDSVINT